MTRGKRAELAAHGFSQRKQPGGLIHRLTYRRTNHNLLVRGYKEGTTTTPFDMAVRNNIDRFQLVIDVIHYVPSGVAGKIRPVLPRRGPTALTGVNAVSQRVFIGSRLAGRSQRPAVER